MPERTRTEPHAFVEVKPYFACALCGLYAENPIHAVVVSEFEWESLQHALVNGLDHPLDEVLENRNVIVDRRRVSRG